jgi:acyl-CoA thioesterase-1
LSLLLLLLPAAGETRSRTILVLGDSISAAYGMEQKHGWVNLLQERLQRERPGASVINASVSGDTTAGGLARLPVALELHRPEVVVIELGGNDGLRGYPVARIRENLERLVELATATGARVLLIGMKIPPNYGKRYTDAFHAVFGDVASRHDLALVPFLLEDVAARKPLMQTDGVHPTAEAQPLLLERVWDRLGPLLDAP